MLKKTLALVALVMSSSVNAAFVSLHSSFGADTITLDTATGLEWLDITETKSRSYNDLNSEFGIGGEFYGWRYATLEESMTLFNNAGFPSGWEVGVPVTQSLSYSADIFFSLFGATIVGQDHLESWILLGAPSESHPNTRISFISKGQDSISYQTEGRQWISKNTVSGVYGSFLVKSSPVPVPAAAWLFGSALIGLLGIKRKK